MKIMQKYFLAIVPAGEFEDQVTDLKLEIKSRFQAKYALKSPPHVTVKMPFTYNEAKEEKLFQQLETFTRRYESIHISIKGVQTFGTRVIYLGVSAGQDLYEFQADLKTFCKREMNLVDELSDRNFHPHMTIAFKDIKKAQFQNILHYAQEVNLKQDLIVNEIVLLKKLEGQWIAYRKLPLKKAYPF